MPINVFAKQGEPSVGGFLSDPQSWKDMGNRLASMIGTPLPTVDELNAMVPWGSVMDYDPKLAQSGMNKLTSLAVMGIVPPSTAEKLNTKTSLPSSDIFNEAVSNTPGAKITPNGLVMRVARSQAPEQGLQPSVRGGVFYLPEGASQMKYYSTGKMGYGGSQKIAGETLFSNPLFVKGGTGGKAPEAAYDSLIGKGAYQAMRDDALKSVRGWNMSQAEKENAVQNFLDKYAPELSDHASYIVNNSKAGNTLPYALQEAAVGSAVRKAGHDAVLGYSKGKAGHFLSEVFDVREMNYPDKFGSAPDIWSNFEK